MTSLSEITNIKGDADLADGGAGGNNLVINTTPALSYLQNLAGMTAQAHRYLLDKHDENLKSYLSDFNKIDTTGLMAADEEALRNQYTDALTNVYNNFSTIRNPFTNPAKAAELKGQEAALRQRLARSQSDTAFLQQQQKFVEVHPEFNTPEYQQQVKQFLATPLGQRQYFSIQAPLTVNPATLGKTIGELAKQKYATSTTDGKRITSQEGEKVDPDKYMALWNNLGVDQYGRPIEDSLKRLYAGLPSEQRAQYGSYSDWKKDLAKSVMPLDQQTQNTVKADEYGVLDQRQKNEQSLLNQRQSFEAGQNAADRAIKLKELSLKASEIGSGTHKIDKNAAGRLKNELAVQAFTNQPEVPGTPPQNVPNNILQHIYGDDTKVSVTKGSPYMGDGSVRKSEAAKVEVISNHKDKDGNLVIHRRDNETGKEIKPLIVPFKKFFRDIDFLKGTDGAAAFSEGSADYLKNNNLPANPTYEDLYRHFNPNSENPNQTSSIKLTKGSLDNL